MLLARSTLSVVSYCWLDYSFALGLFVCGNFLLLQQLDDNIHMGSHYDILDVMVVAYRYLQYCRAYDMRYCVFSMYV